MKTSFALSSVILSIILFCTSCIIDKIPSDEDPLVSGIGVLKYDNQPLIIGDFYPYNDSLEIRFLRVNYLMSPLKFDNAEISSVVHFNFTDKNLDLSSAKAGYKTFDFIATNHQFTDITYGVGLSSKLNGSRPEDFISSHPLSNQAIFWASWNSYIFAMIEGYVKNKNSGEQFSFTYHTGGNNSYILKTVNMPTDLHGKTSANFVIGLDLKKVFVKDGVTFDIMTNLQNHATGTAAVSTYLMENISNAIKFSIE